MLQHRHQRPDLYAHGAYQPLPASGDAADQLCAFARTQGEDALLVVAARFPARLAAGPGWGDTGLPWPPAGGQRWRDLLSGRVVERRGETLAVAALLADLPVAALVPAED